MLQFLPIDSVKRLGFQTKKALKLAMCQHVKVRTSLPCIPILLTSQASV